MTAPAFYDTAIVVVLAFGLLAGCGGDGNDVFAPAPAPTVPAPTVPAPAPAPAPTPAPEPPTVPRGLFVFSIGGDHLGWHWQPVESVSGYDVQYGTSEAFTDQDEVIPRTAEETSYLREGLCPGTRGYLRVRAARGFGVERITSEWSQPVAETACCGANGEVENLRLVESGFDFVTYAWDADPCVEVYDFELVKVYDFQSTGGGLDGTGFVESWGGREKRRVNEPRAIFTGLADGVYGPRVYLNPSENPFGYFLSTRNDRPYWDRSFRHERWEDSPVVCTGDMEAEARRTGSVLLREWDRNRESFTVNVHVSLDNAPGFDADWVLAEAEEAVDRFREVLRTPVLEIGGITSRSERRPGEVLIDYGPYPDRSQPWADDVVAFATFGTGTVTMVKKPEHHGGWDEYDLNLRIIDYTLIHEIFHLFGFRHAKLSNLILTAAPQAGPGVDMTPEMTGPNVDTLQDFAALRCVLGL